MSVSTATPGNYTFTLTCQGTGGPAVATTDVAVNAAGNVAITSLSASPSSIIQGSTSTIIWTTQNADSCSASGGFGTWSGSVPVSGSRNVSTSAVGSYTFTLTCQGAGGPVSDTTNVTVTESAPNCDAPPLGGNEVSWQAFWGEAFPGPKTLLRETQIPFSGWIAVKFNTGSVIGTGGISSIESTRTSGSRFGAISQCPGDFNAPADCQYQWGIGGGIGWTTEGYSGACDLLPDTDYYLNVTFTDGFDPDSSTCDAIPCITKLRYYEF
jgi:PKD repeat protein